MKPGAFIAIIIAAIAAYWLFFGAETGFSDADVASVKTSIKSEFEKRGGVVVSDVQMVRESSKKLIGFAKVKSDGINFEITKSCTATYAERQYLWECK
jgi:hypothetical protein